nr:crinkler 12 [Plasmopara viticola]
MVKLFCAIIGEKRVITIDIDPQEAVGDLKKLITKEAQYECPSHKLALFLAKKNSNKKGEWMTDDDDDLVRFQKATLPTDMERSHLKKELLLKPTWSSGDYFNINDKNFPEEKAIHVLVDRRGRDHASVANDKYSLLIGGRKTRGKKGGDVVEGMLITLELLHSNYHQRMFT